MLTATPPQEQIACLHVQLAATQVSGGPSLAFGIDRIDDRLADHGLDGHALHEVAAASPALSDDAAATLFLAGLAARFAAAAGTVLWAVTRFDLYAPGLDQAGLSPDHLLFSEAREDNEVLALAEDGLRSGTLGAVVAEVGRISMTATRRLQLAAAEGRTPMLLFRRWRRRALCPLSEPSSATTRWRIRSVASQPLGHAGIGRPRWEVELVRQRNGNPFSLTLEACDDTGRLALPAPARHRAAGADRAAARAA
ncbi:ImuA family protein [Sphingomonas chungangi]|uniref:ImuA family protein n=1 Tax=Sphingomonas chungangi TaxID=2683589 RepID=UPI001FE6BAF3|nr:protein ImuA [Sphingomonas chungangi]